MLSRETTKPSLRPVSIAVAKPGTDDDGSEIGQRARLRVEGMFGVSRTLSDIAEAVLLHETLGADAKVDGRIGDVFVAVGVGVERSEANGRPSGVDLLKSVVVVRDPEVTLVLGAIVVAGDDGGETETRKARISVSRAKSSMSESGSKDPRVANKRGLERVVEVVLKV